jgi:hypothetical protein
MMIALFIIALVSGGLIASASLYVRTMKRVETAASEVRHAGEADQMLRRFISVVAAGSTGQWSCDENGVSASCRAGSGGVLSDCAIRLVRRPTGSVLQADYGLGQVQEIAMPNQHASFLCDASFSEHGWRSRNDAISRITIFISNGANERPFVSASAP